MTTEATSPIPLDEPLAARIALAVDRYGERRVVELAIGLLQARDEGDEILLYLGGRHAQGILDGAPALYWPELWGARALGYVWDGGAESGGAESDGAGSNGAGAGGAESSGAEAAAATSAILAGLGNQAWRVREMCARVCRARGIGGPQTLSALLTDEVARVRSAAARALAEVGGAEHLENLRPLLHDQDKDVRRAAQQSLDRLRERTRPAVD